MDAEVASLLEWGGGGRARHVLMGQDSSKQIDRAVGLFGGKVKFTQRESNNLTLFTIVKLRVVFRFSHWEPNAGAQLFPDDGSWKVAYPGIDLLRSLVSVPLQNMPSVGTVLPIQSLSSD